MEFLEKPYLENLITESLTREKHALEEAGDRESILESGFNITEIQEPVRYSGRQGVYYKVEFEYLVEYAEGSFYEDGSPMEPIHFRRSFRMDENGGVIGVSERIEIE